MTSYRVFLVAVAEAVVTVEADDPEEAIELAFDNAPQGANISNDFDMGDWQLMSDIWPDRKAEDDYEEGEDDE